MARLYRDAFGIPHLRADSILDLAHAQGRVTVADRAWQLEWLRRRANGTTAEVAGEPGLSWDRFSRRMRTVETAQRAFAACTEETQRFVSSYVDGVNEALAELDPGTVPELRDLGISAGGVGAVDAAGDVPRPAPAVRQHRRSALEAARLRRARRRRALPLPPGPDRLRQQRLGGRRRPDRERAAADRR